MSKGMAMESLYLFYSWQTDINTKVNKFFIKSALETAIASLKNELIVEDSQRPEILLDHDTKGVPGSPPIIDTIKNKIDQCGIFLADLTYVAHVPEKHGVSNPNVLTERGYALKAVGHERMIAVMNEAYGKADNLPFDLQGTRWPIRYILHPDDSKEKRKQQEKFLINELKKAITTILESGIIARETTNPINFINEHIHEPQKIRQLREVVQKEVSIVFDSMQGEQYSLSNTNTTNEATWARVNQYRELLSTLVNMFIVGCYWGETLSFPIWEEVITRIGNITMNKPVSYYPHWVATAHYPALLLLYAGGIAALKNRKYTTLFMLFNSFIRKPNSYLAEPITSISSAYLPLTKQERGFNYTNYGSTHLHETLRTPFKQFIHDDNDYNYFFSLFELIYNLLFIHRRTQEGGSHHHLFCSLTFRSLRSNNAVEEFKQEILQHGNNHPLLLSGLFEGDIERVTNAFHIIQNIREYAY